ncbi:MAG: serine protease inhibitor, partial [Actinomycetota bacterium]|nr:serine protease inhibitor [Actinomycetota bacterium]
AEPVDAGPPVRLAVVFEAGRGAPAVESTLTCDGGEAVASGAIADRGEDAACARVREIADPLLSEPDPDRVCAAIYGGPQSARVTGTIGDERVERTFSRENGCAISDWDAAVPLLPAVEGAAPPP